MKFIRIFSFALVAASILAMSPAKAEFYFADRIRTNTMHLDGSIGFTVSPSTFLMTFEGSYFFTHHFSAGVLSQLALDGDLIMLAPAGVARWTFDLPTSHHIGRRLKPFAQGGVGFIYANSDTPVGSNDDVGFLIHFGGGLQAYFTNEFSLGTHLLFNVVPTELFNSDSFYFGWQFLTARYHF